MRVRDREDRGRGEEKGDDSGSEELHGCEELIVDEGVRG